jgi:hypothetical protein
MYQPKWSTLPLGASGEKLEFIRDYDCFNEGRAGERVVYKEVEFSQKVEFAEVFLSGFNMWYTKGGDCEVMQIRVDAWVEAIGAQAPDYFSVEARKKAERTVKVKLMYALTDEDTTGPEDFNDACIGFTVVALTKPQN